MLYAALVHQAKKSPDKTAVVGERRSLTFAQLRRAVDAIAAYLQQLGVGVEDRLLVGIPPSPEFYTFFYAAAALGATVIPVLPSAKLPAQFIETHPGLAVGSREFIDSCSKNCPTLRRTVLWDRDHGLHVPEPAKPFRRKRAMRQEQVVAVSSSGTTGTPTVCFQSTELLLERGKLKASVLGVTSDDVLLSIRPFNNGSSINNHVIVPLVKGCKVVVHERFERFKTIDAISRERVTILYAVALVFELLAAVPPSYPVDFSSVRLCISGGGPLSKYIYDRFHERFGICIRQRYGATQIIPAFTYNIAGVPGAVGQVSGPFPVGVLTDRNRPARPEQIGEVVFNVSKFAAKWQKFFHRHPHRRGRYIYTGDLGRLDKDGNLFIVGRKSSFIKVGGNRVEAAEVENILRTHPKVKEASVFPIRAGQVDEAVGAAVVAAGKVEQRELIEYCSQRLDSYKCPRQIEFKKSLPRNENGKVIQRFNSSWS
ncbi:MAG TPA: class I adenylate-forming enzyme family protein [Candidatus Binatia bacterium]